MHWICPPAFMIVVKRHVFAQPLALSRLLLEHYYYPCSDPLQVCRRPQGEMPRKGQLQLEYGLLT
jgi:hypothetical protein